MRQTSHSIQSPGATVNAAAARCRAELSEGCRAPAPSLGTSTPSAHTSCHHTTPPELHSSPRHSITSTSQPLRFLFFFFLRNNESWSLYYSPQANAGQIKCPERVGVLSSAAPPTLFLSPTMTPHASPPAFLEPSVPTRTPAPLN